MFDIGALELLLIIVVAVIVIGPKDMPQAMRIVGRWVGKVRRASAQFRSGFDSMVREAEMEEMEKKWKEQNAKIMAETPTGEMGPLSEHEGDVALPGEKPADAVSADATVEADSVVAKPVEPMLPLDKDEKP